MAISMGRTLSIADFAADIADLRAGFDDSLCMACLMVVTMKRANGWKRLGTVTSGIACKLIAAREREESAAAPGERDGAAARFPAAQEEDGVEGRRGRVVVEARSRAGQSHKAGVKGLAGRDPIQRPASADVFGCAMHASGGNDGAHDLRPLLPSKSSTTTKPAADKRVRSSQ